MQSSNPVLSVQAGQRFATPERAKTMGVAGSLLKTTYAIVVLMIAAAAGWSLLPQLGTSLSWVWVSVVSLATLFVGLFAAFRPGIVSVTLYAALEGLLLGMLSRSFEAYYPGIVVQAILLTITTTLGMLVLYATNAVRVTEKARSVILIATVGVCLYLFFEFFISLFVPGFALIFTYGPVGVIVAGVIVLVAALNLLLDFDFITQGVKHQFAKRVEWYAAFGLLVTLIWLYVSFLRLLAAARR